MEYLEIFQQNSLNLKSIKKIQKHYDIIMDLALKRNDKNHQINVSEFERNSLKPPFGLTTIIYLLD